MSETRNMKFNDEPMISQKYYTAEEYKRKKRKAIGVAKRIIVMSELSAVCLTNTFVSLGLFLLLMMGTSALPYFCDVNIEFTQENFSFRGGAFITLVGIFLILFTIFIFWYAIAYKRLEIMCIHIDGRLKGALEVNEAAQRDNMLNSIERVAGVAPTNFQSIDGPKGLAVDYLQENGVDINNTKVFTGIKVLFILAQILLAMLCLFLLMK